MRMTKQQFRDLLIAYLTDPPYADEAKPIDGADGSAGISVMLEHGEHFIVTVVQVPGS